jgi:hypothetical protein
VKTSEDETEKKENSNNFKLIMKLWFADKIRSGNSSNFSSKDDRKDYEFTTLSNTQYFTKFQNRQLKTSIIVWTYGKA